MRLVVEGRRLIISIVCLNDWKLNFITLPIFSRPKMHLKGSWCTTVKLPSKSTGTISCTLAWDWAPFHLVGLTPEWTCFRVLCRGCSHIVKKNLTVIFDLVPLKKFLILITVTQTNFLFFSACCYVCYYYYFFAVAGVQNMSLENWYFLFKKNKILKGQNGYLHYLVVSCLGRSDCVLTVLQLRMEVWLGGRKSVSLALVGAPGSQLGVPLFLSVIFVCLHLGLGCFLAFQSFLYTSFEHSWEGVGRDGMKTNIKEQSAWDVFVCLLWGDMQKGEFANL